ncbi:MAG: OmpH family outer membrane protein [Bacteroidaceae bacterium]|nr:OmpH family outer membrane protein [Bacteroidaceae bacterium]
MKNYKRITFVLTAIVSLVIFAQCGMNNQPTNNCQPATEAAAGIKVVYVDLDSLMANYNLAKDINKEMMRKEEDIKLKITEKVKTLQANQADFERKYKNNVYATPERAQQEYNRIVKMEQEIAQYEQSMAVEFEKEGTAKNQALRDSISKFIKEYNAEKGYDFILTRIGDNFLYANETLNITKEVVDGLNSRYKSPEEK